MTQLQLEYRPVTERSSCPVQYHNTRTEPVSPAQYSPSHPLSRNDENHKIHQNRDLESLHRFLTFSHNAWALFETFGTENPIIEPPQEWELRHFYAAS